MNDAPATVVTVADPQTLIAPEAAQNVLLTGVDTVEVLSLEDAGPGVLETERDVFLNHEVEAPFFLSAGEVGPKGRDGINGTVRFVEDYFELTPAQVSARAVTLSDTPLDPNKVQLVPFYGIEQRLNVDFVVTGSVLSWHGLALELILVSGDNIVVRYVAA